MIDKKVRQIFNSIFPCRLGKLRQFSSQGALILPRGAAGIGPRFSIVTPSYMQGDYIKATIDSVLGQGVSSLEYIIQDSCSNDNTSEVLRSVDSGVIRIFVEKDSGQADAVNRGFAKTSGEIMAWINSDDILLPGALKCVDYFFEAYPDVDIFYGNRLIIDSGSNVIGRWILPSHSSSAFLWRDYIPQETLFWRRSAWNKIGASLDASLRFAMDWDLIARFYRANCKFMHIPRFLGAFRVHELQKTTMNIHDIGYSEMKTVSMRLHGRDIPKAYSLLRRLPYLLRQQYADACNAHVLKSFIQAV